MSSRFVTHLDPSLCDDLRSRLQEKGFVFSQPPYTLFQARSSSVCCTLYTSHTLVVQGKGTQEFVEFFLEPEILQTFSLGYEERDLRARIGVDESGKGDFFGPLCVAGVLAKNEEEIAKLYDAGIQDSKKLTDRQNHNFAQQIRSICAHDILIIYPQKYNELYAKFRNLNSLLAWGHATVIHNLSEVSSSVEFAISDQFASSEQVLIQALKRKKCSLPLIQRTKAEQDVVVAAASILARDAFVTALQKLELQYSVRLPKGASQAVKDMAKDIAAFHGKDVLSSVCKTHFKTFEEVL